MEDNLTNNTSKLNLTEDKEKSTEQKTTDSDPNVEPDETKETESAEEDSEEDSNSAKDEMEAQLLKERADREDKLSDEERMELRNKAQLLKDSGNGQFRQQCYVEAVSSYTEALSICPLCFAKDRAIMHSNRAAAHMHRDKTDLVIKDCTDSLALHPHYPKPLLRRAQTYEKLEKLDEALEDYKLLLELDNKSLEALAACQRLPKQIEERNEKLKSEMLGKLKDLGNLVLRPFGLSTDNFKLQQNESGGYSVNFSNS